MNSPQQHSYIYLNILFKLSALFILFFSCVELNNSDPNFEEQNYVSIADKISTHSVILNEERTVYIYLPESYNQSTFEYPVLYLLDAEYEFHHTTGLIDFLASTEKIPEMIVVGIENTNRSRDLTPEAPNDLESQKFWGEIGGADSFIRYLNEELFPYIDSEYRTAPYRLLRGQSFGGLFAMYDLLEGKQLFNAYLTSSPQISWNEKFLWRSAQNFDSLNSSQTKVYIGEAENDFPNEIREFSNTLIDGNQKGIDIEYDFFENEDHYSLVHNATEKGLKFVYRNFSFKGLTNLDDVEVHFEALSKELGYSISVPMNVIISIGNSYLRKQDYSNGILTMKYGTEVYPNQPQIHWHLGGAYSLKGEFENAEESFLKAYTLAKKMNLSDLDDYKRSLDEIPKKIN